jgi:hypothetical protein
MKHGVYGYGSGCRCDICRAANTAKVSRRRARRQTEQSGITQVKNTTSRNQVVSPTVATSPPVMSAPIYAREVAEQDMVDLLSALRDDLQWTGHLTEGLDDEISEIVSLIEIHNRSGQFPQLTYVYTVDGLEISAVGELDTVEETMSPVYIPTPILPSVPSTVMTGGSIGKVSRPKRKGFGRPESGTDVKFPMMRARQILSTSPKYTRNPVTFRNIGGVTCGIQYRENGQWGYECGNPLTEGLLIDTAPCCAACYETVSRDHPSRTQFFDRETGAIVLSAVTGKALMKRDVQLSQSVSVAMPRNVRSGRAPTVPITSQHVSENVSSDIPTWG